MEHQRRDSTILRLTSNGLNPTSQTLRTIVWVSTERQHTQVIAAFVHDHSQRQLDVKAAGERARPARRRIFEYQSRRAILAWLSIFIKGNCPALDANLHRTRTYHQRHILPIDRGTELDLAAQQTQATRCGRTAGERNVNHQQQIGISGQIDFGSTAGIGQIGESLQCRTVQTALFEQCSKVEVEIEFLRKVGAHIQRQFQSTAAWVKL